MDKPFLKKYLELIFATASIYFLACALFGLLTKIPAIGNRFKNSIEFSGMGVVVPILLLIFLFVGTFVLARRWTVMEKEGVANSARWHKLLHFIITIEVAFITFSFVSFFFMISTSLIPNSKDLPFFVRYPYIGWGMYIIGLVPVVLVMIKKTRKLGARWCLLLSAASFLQLVFDPNSVVPLASYLFFCLLVVSPAILLMLEGSSKWGNDPIQMAVDVEPKLLTKTAFVEKGDIK